jgi:hypothetical protein
MEGGTEEEVSGASTLKDAMTSSDGRRLGESTYLIRPPFHHTGTVQAKLETFPLSNHVLSP